MDIKKETLEQDRKYFSGKLEEAQKEFQEIQNLIFHLQGVLDYNNQLTHFLDEEPAKVEVVVKKKEKKHGKT